MASAPDGELSTLVADRIEFLRYLAIDPADKRTMTADLDPSRSTVDRAMRELTAAGLVAETPEGYHATLAGRLATVAHQGLTSVYRRLGDARQVLEALPQDCGLPRAAVTDGTVVTLGDAPHDAFQHLAGPLDRATTYRAVFPAIADSRHLRRVQRCAATDDLDADLWLAPTARDALVTEFPGLAADLADADGVTVAVVDDPGYGLFVADSPAETTVSVVAVETGTPVGLVQSAAPAVVDWAAARVADHDATATDVTASLRTDPDPALAVADRPLDRSLAASGFERVDLGTLAAATPTPATLAWRTGFDLVDVAAGHPVERRRDGEDRPVSLALADRLQAGASVAVVGPPDAGKSTTCRAVACRWLDRLDGTVCYRRSPATGGGSDAGPVVDAIDRSTGPVLVVVEDAADRSVRPTVRRVLDRAAGDDDVAVLLEASERDWQRLAARPARGFGDHHAALEAVRLPAVTEATCEAAIERFEAVTGRTVPLDAADLAAHVDADADVDGMAVLADVLTSVTDPEPWDVDGEADSPVAAAAAAAADDIRPDDAAALDAASLPALAVETALVAAALAAADRRVSPVVLHAVAAARAANEAGDGLHTAAHRRVDAAIDALDGTLLFDDPDADAYRTQHRTWLVQFLAHALERDGDAAVAAFERGLNAVLALADDATRREHVATWLDLAPDDLAADPTVADRDGVARAVFAFARRHGDLAPFLGTADDSDLALDALDVHTRLVCQTDRAAAWWLHDHETAAGEARAVLAAVDGADRDPQATVEHVVEARHVLADVAEDRGDFDAARDHLADGLAVAHAADDALGAVRLANQLGRVATRAGDLETAARHLAAARERGTDLEPCAARSTTFYALGELARKRGDLDVAATHLDRAADVEDDAPDVPPTERASTLNARGMVEAERGAHDRAEACYRRALAIERDAGNHRGRVAALCNLGSTLLEAGDRAAAREALEEAHSLAGERDLADMAAVAEAWLGRAHLDAGDLDAAEDAFRSARDDLQAFGDDVGVANRDRNLGDVARERGDHEAAIERYAAAYETYADTGTWGRLADTAAAIVEAADAAGDPDTAREWCERAAATLRDADREDDAARIEARLDGDSLPAEE